jgi:hypothetical protein
MDGNRKSIKNRDSIRDRYLTRDRNSVLNEDSIRAGTRSATGNLLETGV